MTYCEEEHEHERRGRRWGTFFGAAYLVFLAGPVIGEVQSHRPVATTVAVLAVLAAFAGLNLLWWATLAFERELGPRALAVLAAMAAIAAGLTLHESGWVWSFIYVGVAVAASSWNRWRSAVLVAVVVVLTVATGLVARVPMDVLPDVLLIVVMAGFGMLGTSHLIETNFQLRQAREEVGRLAVAEERLRFARDLHDLLGHSLSVIVLKSELAARLSGASPERAADEIRDVERVAREALREVREAVAGYRQLGLSQELESVRATLGAAGIEARLLSTAGALPTPVDSTLAWALREGVTNVLRHSRASRVDGRVVRSDDHVELELLDDGVGCDGCGDGNGLRGLRERVAARDGSLNAGPRPEGGFRLAVRLPLQDAPHTAPAPA